MQILMAKIVKTLHFLILFFVLLGWLSPWQNVLLVYLVFLPLMVLQWLLNKGSCVLTNLENWILGKTPDRDVQAGAFLHFAFQKICRFSINDKQMFYLTYALLAFFWGVGFCRYFSFFG